MSHHALVPTPIGNLVVSGPGPAVSQIAFGVEPRGRRDDEAFSSAVAQLAAWFAGARRSFELEVAVDATPFQARVWDALRAIPYGATSTYADLARTLGSSPRAVGSANARNPLAVVIPCHRLVGSSGALTGYAYGLDRKRWLIDHERAVAEMVGSSSLRP